MDKRIDVKAQSGAVETHTVSQATQDATIQVQAGTEVRLFAQQGDIESMQRQGHDLIIKYTDGTVVRLVSYFDCPTDEMPKLVLDDQNDASGAEQVYKAELDPAACFAAGDTSSGPVAFAWVADGGAGLSPLLLGGLAVLGAGIGIAAASGGGSGPHGHGGSSAATPDAPSAQFNADGTAVTGHGAPNATIVVTDGSGKTIGTGTADGQGNFTVPLTEPQNNGQQVDVTQTTPGGTSPTTSLTAPDLTAPDEPVIHAVTDDVGATTGTIASGGVTDDNTPTLSGTAEANSRVTVYDNGVAIGSATADAFGNWSFTPGTALADGAHNFSVTATDAAGNVSALTPIYEVTVDTTAPSAPTVNPTDGAPGSVVSGTAEPGSTVAVDTNGDGKPDYTTTTDGGGNWSVTIGSELPAGSTVTATATDPAGNTSAPGTVTVGAGTGGDTTPPAAPVINDAIDDVDQMTGSLASGSITNDALPTLTGTTEANATVTVYDNGVMIGTAQADSAGAWAFTPATPLVDGAHSFTTTATDAAGNVSTASAAYDLTVDATPPATPTVDPTDGAAGSVLTGTAEAGAMVAIDVDGDGQADYMVAADENGIWSVALRSAVSDGSTITAIAMDTAGNMSAPGTGTVDAGAVDTTPPATPVIAAAADDVGSITGTVPSGGSTDDTTPTLSGTAEANSTVAIYDNGTQIGTANADASGAWTFTPTSPLAEGAHAITTTATDAAGNTSPASAAYELTVDTTAPDAPSINPTNGADGAVLSGTAEPGATVAIDVNGDGSPDYTTTADGDGNWSVPLDGAVPDGTAISATATDAAGNTGAPGTVTVDASAPDTTPPAAPVISAAADDAGAVIGNVPSGGSTDDNTPTLSGTAEADSTVTVYDNGAAIGTAVANGSGAWTFTPPAALADGQHSFTSTATDAAGNVGPASAAYDVTIDTAAPSAPAIGSATDDAGPVTGPIASGGTTDDTTPTLTGTAEPDTTVTVYDNGNTIGTTVTDGSGNWSYTPTTPLGDGAHDLTTTATDAAGNTSPASGGYQITIDTAAPVAPAITSATDDVGANTGVVPTGGSTDDTTPTLTGTAEANATVAIYDNGTQIGTVVANGGGAWTFTPATPLAEGAHSFTSTATDAAGNVSAGSAAYDLSVDTTAPAAPTVNPTNGADGSVLSGTAEPGATVGVDVNGDGRPDYTTTADPDGNWSVPLNGAVPDGTTISATATDAAGNTGAPGTTTVDASTPDTTAPAAPVIAAADDDVGAVTGTVPAGGSTDDATPTLTGTAEANATVHVYDNGTEIGTASADATGAWNFTPATPLADGAHAFTTTATDAAGNTGPASAAYDVTVDTATPAAPVIGSATDDVGATTGPIASGGTTDDNTPTLNGTAEANALVTVYDNGVALGTTTANGTGVWSFTPTAPLENGAHAFTSTATDAAGNTGPASVAYDINVDATAPAAPVIGSATDDVGATTGPIASGGTTDDNTPTLNGTSEPNATITVYDNGAAIGTAVADGTGAWAFTPTTPLADGAHALTTTATDAAGNTGAQSAPYDINVDATAPAAPVIGSATDDAGDVTGPIAAGGTTDDNTPTLNGTAEPNSTITVYDNGNAIGTATADGTGAWSFTPATPLDDGSHALTTTATDAAGNTGPASPAYDINIDATAPAAPAIGSATDDAGRVTGPIAAGGTTDDNTPTLNGSAEPNATVTVYDNGDEIGTTTADGTGAWSFTPTTPLADGAHALTATATDAAGNAGPASPAYTINVDATAPAAPAIASATDDVGATTGPIAAGGTTDDNTPTLNGTAEANATVTVYDNGVALGTVVADGTGAWTFTPTAPLADGAHAFTTTVTDAAGNTGEASPAYTVNIDATAPATPAIGSATDDAGAVTGPIAAGGTTDDNTPTLNGSGEPNATITVYDNGNEIGTTTADGTGAWSFTPATPLADGAHALTSTATDAAGNTSAPSPAYTINVDATPPAAPAIGSATDDAGTVTGPIASGGTTDDNTPSLTGTAEANATVTVYDNDTAIGTAVADGTGAWTFTPTAPLADGAHAFTSTASDAAGNTGPQSAAYTVNIDATAPAAPTIGSATDDVGATTGPVASGGTTDDNTPTLNGTAEANATVTVYDNGDEIGTTTADGTGAWSFTPTAPLENGTHAFTSTATDAAGNTGAASPAYTVNVDATAPDAPTIGAVSDDVGPITGTVPAGGTTDDAQPLLTGTAEANAVITVYDDGAAIGTARADGSGVWGFTPDAPLDNGHHAFTTTATDVAGNVGPQSAAYDVTVDAVAPAAPGVGSATDDAGTVTGPLASGDTTDDTTPTLTGNSEPNATVTIYDNGTPIGTAPSNEAGEWTYTPTTPLGDGVHEITVTATDAAGNTSPPSAGYELTIDTAAPQAPVIASATDDVGATTGAIPSGGTTDDDQPLLTGTAEANATVTVYDNGAQIGTAIVSGTGAWSFTPTTPLDDGPHSFTATSTDVAGNTGPASAPYALTVDTAAPLAPSIDGASDDVGAVTGNVPSGGTTDDAQPLLSGTAEANATVTVYDNGAAIGTVVASGTGAWSFTPTTPLDDGPHSLTATATDAAGNTGAQSAPYDLTVDTAVPVAPTITSATDDVGASTGVIASGGTTDDTQPLLSGTAEANATVTVYDNGAAIGTAVASGTGAWSFTPTTPLDDGPHSFTATTTDAAGNTGVASAAYDLTVDTAAPVAPSIGAVTDDVGATTGVIAAGATTDDDLPLLTGTAEANSTVTVYDNGAAIGTAVASGTGAWSFTPTAPLDDGPHSFTATTTDAAGNTGEQSAPYDIVVDTVAPVAPTIASATDDVGASTGVVASGGTTDDTQPLLSGTAEANATVTVYDNGAAIGTAIASGTGAWSFTPTTPLDDGPHSFTATTTDAAGNTGAQSAPYDLTVDTAAPVAPTITSATDDVGATTGVVASGGTTDDTQPLLTGTAEANATVTVYDNGAAIGTAVASSTGAWSFTPIAPLEDGPHSFTATTTDAAGNTGVASAAYDLTVDTAAPVAPTITSATDDVGTTTGVVASGGTTDDNLPLLTGTAEANATVTVYDNGAAIGTAVASGTGAWSFTPVAPLDDGPHSFTATTTDAAGNTGVASAAYDLTVDTAAPVAPTIASLTDDVGAVTGVVASGGTTDDNLPLLSGTSEPNATVTLYDNGAQIGTVTASGTGDWSFTPTAPLDDGLHSFTATTTDAAGNTGVASAAYDVTVDTAAPVAPTITSATDDVGTTTGVVASGGTTDDNLPLLTGTAEANATVTVYDNGAAIGTAVASGTGAWSFTPVAPLDDGPHSFTATTTDAAGNTGLASAAYDLTVDTAAPVAPTITSVTDDVGVTTGVVAPGGTTDDNLPLLTGTAEANATVTIYDNGAAIGTATASGTGAWSFTPVAPLDDGPHNFTATTTDAAGNTGAESDPYGVTVDTAAPVAPTITSATDDVGAITGVVASGGTTDDAQPLLTGTAESNATVTIYDNGAAIGTATASGTGAWSFTPTAALDDGPHSFTATTTDAAGNTGVESAAYVIDVDTAAPAAPTLVSVTDNVGVVTGVVTAGTSTDDNTPTLNGTAESNSTVTIYDNGAVIGTATANDSGDWNFTPTAPLDDGAHSFTVTSTDAAGNTGASSAAYDVTVDTEAPFAPAITSANDDVGTVTGPVASGGTTDDTTPTFSGTAEANAVINLYDNGVPIGTAAADGNGGWTFTPTAPFAEGPHTITATATDAAGNTSTGSVGYDLTVTSSDTLDAVPDTATLDGGGVVAVEQAPVTSNDVLVLGVAEADDGTDGSQAFTIAPNSAGILHIEVTQTSLVAVADAYQIDVVDANGNVVYSATSSGQLLGGVGNVGVLGVVGDNTLTADVGGLPAGTYHVVVHNADQSTLTDLLDSNDDGGVSLTELGNSGVLLGPDNETLILDTVANALDGSVLGIPLGNLGSTIVEPLLQTALDAVNATGQETPVSALVGILGDVLSNNAVTTALAPLGLDSGDLLNSVISTLASTLLSNTLSLLQQTSITTQYTGYAFENGDLTGNVITDPAGADNLGVNGNASVTQVTWDSTTVGVDAVNGATIQGLYGSLHINADGSYTYTGSGDPAAFNHSDVFTYTLSDGIVADSATLTINIVDTVAPVVTPTITAISDDTGTVGDWRTTDVSPTIIGHVDAPLATGERVQVSIDGGAWTDATIDPSDASGTTWFFGPGALSGGAHTVTVQVVDQSGNVDTNTASQVVTIDTSNQSPVVALNNGLLGGLLGVDALELADIGNQTFVAYDTGNNLQSVSIEYSVPINIGAFDLAASNALATELGLQYSVDHGNYNVLTGAPESSTLTITSLTGGTIDNQAVLELLGSVYLDTALNIGVAPTYSLTATDAGGLSATTSSTTLANLGLGTTINSSIMLGTTNSETITGSSADEHIYGFGGNDVLHGNDGNDLLRGGVGADSLYGDGGNDVLVYDANDIVIDGGDGDDTLLIEDAVASIVGKSTPVQNIETIQLGSDNGAHTLTLDAAGANKATGGAPQLTIEGSQNDTVNLAGGVFHGQVLINNHAYESYTLGSTTVLIEDQIHVNVTPI